MAVQFATAAVDPPTPHVALPLGGAAKKWPAAEVRGLLQALCKQVLERDTDPLIEASFGEGLSGGTLSVRDVVHSLAMSELYQAKYGSPGLPGEAVKHAYRRLLAREGEPAGVSYWTPICKSQGAQAVIRGHVTCKEYFDRFGLDKVPFPAPAQHASGFNFGRALKAVVKVAKQAMHKK